MMKLLTVEEMLTVERASDAAGHSYSEMMACAGRSLAQILHERYGGIPRSKVLALLGKGNNGGDALVAMEHLSLWGWDISCVLVGREPDAYVARVEQAGGQIHAWPGLDDALLSRLLSESDLIVDGLLGTGIRLPLRPPVDRFLALVKSILPPGKCVAAVDTPSGADCRSGAAAPDTIPAELTVTMAGAKAGLFAFPAANFVGELVCADIGLPADLSAWTSIRRRVVDHAYVRTILPSRPPDAHKGTFGTTVICAGSTEFAGAALLAGKAAFRVGAGLVTTACAERIYRIIAGHFPESTWIPLESDAGALNRSAAQTLLAHLTERVKSLLVGPGFGLAPQTAEFLGALFAQRDVIPPLVVDADGLKLLAGLHGWQDLLPAETILTPHPGEMAALTGLSTAEIGEDRLTTAEHFARLWGHTVVLKGAFTLVCSPDGRTALIPISTPALARAGTGDVLAGMIAGLRAQGVPAFEAAAAGAWLHAQAGLAAEKRLGGSASVLAGDVSAEIAAVMAMQS